MVNSIDAHIEFCFKGETHTLSSTLDLDRMLEKYIEPPSLHHVLAVEHGINTYSYLYEVMEVEEIEFDNPKGLAVQFLHDGEFDLEGFAAQRGDSQMLDSLQAIALREMGIENFEQHPKLKSALIQAYQLGMEA
ncbi:MAG TPA: hypothetical protein VFW53_07005 [Gallionella sp.]|nr:hypothetical protein [Gallionella sp.]